MLRKNRKVFFYAMRSFSFTKTISLLIAIIFVIPVCFAACGIGDSGNLTTIGSLTGSTAETSEIPDITSGVPGTTSEPGTATTPGGTTALPTTSTGLPTTAAPTTTTPTTTAPVTPPTRPEPADADIVRVRDYIPDVYVNLRYSSSDNLAKTPIYGFDDAYLRYGTVKKLAAVQSELKKQNMSLLIWDAYRPYNYQHKLFMILPTCASDPKNGAYVGFNTGAALAVAVVASDGTKLPLPSDFDESGKKSDRDFSDLTREQAKYATILDRLMLANGFNQYLNTKWYRYTDSTTYPVDYAMTLDKEGVTVCEKWTVNCQNTLNLRKYASSSATVLTRIPKGEKVTVFFMQSRFAYIDYKGTRGYVVAAYLAPDDSDSWKSELKTVKPVTNYTYDTMNSDLRKLAEEFPNLLSVTSIGKSELGKELTLAVLGNPNAKKRVFISAAIHAREHMTATISVAQIEYMLRNPNEKLSGDGLTFAQLLDKTCFYILPMSNPDGIEIAQTGVIPEGFRNKYGSRYASIWKANALGTDLNMNFDAEWEKAGNTSTASKTPAYLGYKGTAPESAAESKAIAEYVRNGNFDLVLCYHTHGSVIYWNYGNDKKVINKSCDIARRVAAESGYVLDEQGSTSVAGLKDYVMSKLKIPSLTIEFGSESSPLNIRDFDNIWVRTKNILAVSAIWLVG